MSLFVDRTKRSASELLVDLSACRQFRHISKEYHIRIIDRAFLAVAKAWMGPKAVKHPNPNNPCTNCGNPRSKFSFGPGLCYRCYASEGKNIRELWLDDVFVTAIRMRGITCDGCARNFTPAEHEHRAAVIQILANIDGEVKPVLCPGCAQNFKAFCSRNYGQGAWRISPPRDLEKMALAWFAQQVKVLADKVKRAA